MMTNRNENRFAPFSKNILNCSPTQTGRNLLLDLTKRSTVWIQKVRSSFLHFLYIHVNKDIEYFHYFFNQRMLFEAISLSNKILWSRKVGAHVKTNGLFVDCDYQVTSITFFCSLLMTALVKCVLCSRKFLQHRYYFSQNI